MEFKKIFVLCLALTTAYAIDYCNDKETKCDSCCTGSHVACGKTLGEFGPACSPNATLIEMTDDVIDVIVGYHNEKRNDIALGNVPPYEPAKRMAAMVWDPELAKNAQFNVQTCIFAHDPCRTTADFSAAGQNIALVLYDLNMKKYDGPATDMAQELVSGWFEMEYKNGDMSVINDLVLPEDEMDPKQIGHFSQLAWHNAYAIGCAGSKYLFEYQGEMKNAAMLTCDYAVGNIEHEKVYESGPTASECKTGPNPDYPGLCNYDEQYESEFFN